MPTSIHPRAVHTIILLLLSPFVFAILSFRRFAFVYAICLIFISSALPTLSLPIRRRKADAEEAYKGGGARVRKVMSGVKQ